jgi:drug/metabolite transporter (DMT)-like permease
VFIYVRAQRKLGAAKTSAFYAVAPFIGSFLAFVLLNEKISTQYLLALFVMIFGTGFVVYDTLLNSRLDNELMN